MKFTHKFIAAAVLSSISALAFAQAGETVKIVMIEAFSGLMAPVGNKPIKDSTNFWQKNTTQIILPKLNLKSFLLTTNLALQKA
jgi:hypothetical protein